MTLSLNTQLVEGGDERIVFLHGLMGQGRNFRTVSKDLADYATSLLVDLPNHGSSPHTEEFDYVQMAEAVAASVRETWPEGTVNVVGHSMGGKVAMAVALLHPDLVDRLAVVDISPVSTENSSEFTHLLGSMTELDLDAVERRSDVDEALEPRIPNFTTRAFLLQNLTQTEDGWGWKANLDMLLENLGAVMGFPEELRKHSFDGPVLWIAGGDSDYVQEEYRPAMEELFPRTRLVTVKDSGHWVHSEQPEVFHQTLRNFLLESLTGGEDE
ncbi:alpha/beta fold hydrolase [Kytococcus sp. Marseille-QA3725]